MSDGTTDCGQLEVKGTLTISVTLRVASGAVEVVSDGRVMFEYPADACERHPNYDAVVARRHGITMKQARDLFAATTQEGDRG